MRSMTTALYLTLCFVGLLVALLFGFIALVAFLDAQSRACPGNQCSDAIGSMVMGVTLAAVGLLALLVGLRGMGR